MYPKPFDFHQRNVLLAVFLYYLANRVVFYPLLPEVEEEGIESVRFQVNAILGAMSVVFAWRQRL